MKGLCGEPILTSYQLLYTVASSFFFREQLQNLRWISLDFTVLLVTGIETRERCHLFHSPPPIFFVAQNTSAGRTASFLLFTLSQLHSLLNPVLPKFGIFLPVGSVTHFSSQPRNPNRRGLVFEARMLESTMSRPKDVISSGIPRPGTKKMRSLGVIAMFLVVFLTPRCALSEPTCSDTVRMKNRATALSISEFGAVGDGKTDNTWAFRKAMYRIGHLKGSGGTLLYIPPGVWLTGSFNLSSRMTLYLAKGATIKATQDTWNWPLISPLPSYGRGRELPGGRYMSFIHGDRLHDVIITGENGTIDGSGEVWWNMWRQRTLRYTRPNLLELMHSTDIIISNVVLRDSPFWNIHPVYCSNVVVRYTTILAPKDSPNTDGVDPDSSSNVCIEDSFISVGDDLVAVKSGWDEYGIAYGRPSYGITIRRITGSTPFSGIAIGSEASGGVENVLVENINLYNSGYGIHIKTNTGRGGYIKNVTVSGMTMNTVRYGLSIVGDAGDHPDENFNPGAIPVVEGITIKDLWGEKIQQAGSILGIKNSPFRHVCLSNVKFYGATGQLVPWRCTDVLGSAVDVQPWPCSELISTTGMGFCSVGA